jgi:leucyl aminopeptidase
MNIIVQDGTILQQPTPIAIIGMCDGDELPTPLSSLCIADDIQTETGKTTLLYSNGAVPAKRIVVLGMGKRDALTLDGIRQAAAQASKKVSELFLTAYTLHLPRPDGATVEHYTQACVEGARLGTYRYLLYKTDPKREETYTIETMTLMVADGEQDDAQHGVAMGNKIVNGVMIARDLANAPGNILYPETLAQKAQDACEKHGIAVQILSGNDLADFGGLRAVGQGSQHSPRFIILEYNLEQTTAPLICLVGKGITFDSGGISIKPGQSMDDMKMDMSGAAAVIGIMQTVADMKVPCRVVGLISSAENMPSSTAYKPGDIIKTRSGKNVEVLNTDAEGRIVLADALHYAQQYAPDAIIDMATLTGAIGIALGAPAIGLFSNNDTLAHRILRAGEQSAERAWQLPLWDEYHNMVKSTIADIRNIGTTREAGSITAAAFLSAFVGDYPWVHLDIAATAWTDKPLKTYHTIGATGVGVRLIVQALREWHITPA